MSRKSKTKQIKWYESCKSECRLDPIICNNKQKWNKDKCRCECKKLFHKNVIKILSGILVIVSVNIKNAAHLLREECEEVIDNKTVPIKKYNKTVSVKNCNSFDPSKPYIALPIIPNFISKCNNYWCFCLFLF